MNKEILQAGGIDYDGGLPRFMNQTEFFNHLLSLFLEDDCAARAKSSFEAADKNGFFTAVHELKGVSGNLSITNVYQIACALTERYRAGEFASLSEEVEALYTACEAAKKAIREAMENEG